MIKKISAIVLALVLCLSVVVMPASALDLGSAEIGYEIKLDKEFYSAGDTAIVSVYINAKDTYELGTGLLMIGMSSAVFAQADNATSDISATAVGNETMQTFWKTPDLFTYAWASPAQISAVSGSNSEAENAMYDQYLRITIARATGTDYGTKNGLPAADLNADAEPFMQFELKVAEGVADGTVINVGIPGGVLAKNQTYVNYYKSPGTATTIAKISNTGAVSNAATATVGKATPELTIVKDKTQINFDPDQNGYYEGKFAIRQFVEFDNLLDVFGTAVEAKDGADGTGLTEVGFVYATTDKYNKTDALAVIDAGASSGAYTLDNDAYISTTAKAGSYVMGYTVKNIADKSVSLTILAYAKYVVDGEEDIATFEIAGDYSDIYEQFESKIDLLKKPVTE